MEITRIKIEYKDDERKKAEFSITFNQCLTINFCYIVKDMETNQNFITFPFIKKENELLELIYPTLQKFRDEITNKVLELYENHIDEYVKTDVTECCKVTNIKGKLANPDSGMFETEIILDDSFKINKLVIGKRGNNYMYYYPFSKSIDETETEAVTFDTDEIKKEIFESFENWLITNNSNLKFVKPDIKTPEERRERSNKKIKELGVACYDNLRTRESLENVIIKDIDIICKKAIASLSAIQVTCDINNGKYKESVEYFSKMLDKFESKNYLNSKEKRLFDGTYSKQDAIDIDWEYEIYWAIIWALGLIDDDISDASNICNCKKAISVVFNSKNYEEFKSKCKMRTIEEILDMLDLYFRYDWAVTEKRIKPDTSIGKLNPAVVVERRRGLEWLISDKDDWYDISLNT